MTGNGNGHREGCALVTGASRGIGAAVAAALAEEGWPVGLGYRSGADGAQRVAYQIAAAGGTAVPVPGDVSDPGAVEDVFGALEAEFGPVLVLVNNAGITADKMVAKMEVDDWDRVVQVNLSGTFYMSQLAYLSMAERGMGRIVSISSVIGEKGNAGQVNYAATKSGLFGMTMSMAQEGARKGVTVNCVAPGYIETDMVAGVPQKAIDAIVSQVPVGRLGQPDEVARVVEFLADPDAAYITGQVFNVNGGLYMSA
jgi:NAD(P)-dependent dehydrogenase (short-subunit alcohol dehydrogenase family)